MTKIETLEKYFGYTSFRVGQEELIESLLEGKDALGIMPTGGGKSICYQLPAVMLAGVTLVISPLIALMKDQVDSLNENGIASTFINSTLSDSEVLDRFEDMVEGKYKLVYVAPERLGSSMFMSHIRRVSIGLVAVDEAHCISQWGHDFRPSYRSIPTFINQLSTRPPIAAFTATATKAVTSEIVDLLSLENASKQMTGFDRPNLFYKVVAPNNKFNHLVSYLNTKVQGESGIIYSATRKTVESLSKKLGEMGYRVAGYHGGMAGDYREDVQEKFINDDIDIIIATNAFGMGIDKPDVRFVLHYNMPKNMEAYYQEAGRAGRDGIESECVLMYSPSDIMSQKLIIESDTQSDDRKALLMENLQYLINYCHTDQCLRHMITKYFDESSVEKNCGSCGNCINQGEKLDVTISAQKILSCIYRTNQRFGMNMIIQVLRGSKDKKVLGFGLDKQSTYGLMAGDSKGQIREITMSLMAEGYIRMTTDQYPVIKLNEKAKLILKGKEKVFINKERFDSKKTDGKTRKPKVAAKDMVYNEDLYTILSDKRNALAREKGLPGYAIFNNQSLAEMASVFPRTDADFLNVNGVGQKKLETYGKVFMPLIDDFCKENNIDDVAIKLIDDKNKLQRDAVASKQVSKKRESKEEKLENTYAVYLSGATLKDMASQRGFTSTTIINQLVKCQESGKIIDWSRFIDSEKKDMIVEEIKVSGYDSLKALKEKLPESVSYEDLHIVINAYKSKV